MKVTGAPDMCVWWCTGGGVVVCVVCVVWCGVGGGGALTSAPDPRASRAHTVPAAVAALPVVYKSAVAALPAVVDTPWSAGG
jgi:hypothetical protein